MKLKYISWLPAAAMMILIFCFSSRPAVNSNESSMSIANEIINVYENITGTHYDEIQRPDIEAVLNHVVRKGAHFCEYAVLACLIAFHLAVWRVGKRMLILAPILLSAFYAMTDEFHQTFIPGRAGMVKDVLLDTSGAAAGTLFFILVILIITKKHGKLALS